MSGFKLIGWFVVGEGKFGEYVYGREFVLNPENESPDFTYWETRGYEMVPVFVRA